jgi:hypothetical protein
MLVSGKMVKPSPTILESLCRQSNFALLQEDRYWSSGAPAAEIERRWGQPLTYMVIQHSWRQVGAMKQAKQQAFSFVGRRRDGRLMYSTYIRALF